MGRFGRFRSDGAAVDHESVRLRGATTVEGVVEIGAALPRVPVRICGEVRQIRLVPHEYSKVFEVVVADGTGEAVLAFNGNRRIAGLDPGRRVLAEGVGRSDRRRLRLVNPSYTLLP
ncbi:MAG: hypothetical protein MUE34_14090 [Acidimicrobiales bacterium]|jgi:hypothetical protein|nr:hypothetical protein [Acidimicrobiales bacterium]